MTTDIDLLANADFIKLNSVLNKFNVFHATDMKKREVKHTKFLAYLLDPNESHGFGKKILTDFLLKCIGLGMRFNIFDYDLDFSEVKTEVKLGKGRIDVLIAIPEKSCEKKLIICIENKIRAHEANGQLDTYKNHIDAKHPNDCKFYLYLTVDGDTPNGEGWRGISYTETIIPAIQDHINLNSDTISDYMRFILQDYIDLLFNERGDTTSDTDEAELIASRIPDDLINYIRNPGSQSKTTSIYRRSVDFIRSYDNDPRIKVLKFLKNNYKIFRINVTEITGIELHIDSSNRAFIRYSIQSQATRNLFSGNNGISNNPSRRWLDSHVHLAVEFGLKEITPGKSYRLRTSIVMGPTNVDFIERNALLNCFRSVEESNDDANTAQYYGRVGIINIPAEYINCANREDCMQSIKNSIISTIGRDDLQREIIRLNEVAALFGANRITGNQM